MRKELTLTLLRQRDVIQRISVTPREVDQYLEKQKNAPEKSAEYNVSHILIAVPQAATPEQLDEADKRAKDVYKRASGGEDFAQARHRVLEQPDGARGRRARLAQGLGAADVPHRSRSRSSSPAK